MPNFVQHRGWNNWQDHTPGVSAEGLIHRDYEFVDGVVAVYYAGQFAGGVTLSQASFLMSVIPSGVPTGEDVERGQTFVQFQAEDGSVASQDFSGSSTSFRVALKELTVNVNKANGEPANKSPVIIDNKRFTTDGRGRVQLGSSGTAEVTAARAALTKDVDLSGGSGSVTFTMSGLEGKVRTPEGSPIANADVAVLTQAGEVIAEDRTDDDGEFKFDRMPVGAPLIVESEPFTREFNSGSEGQYLLKNLPFNTENVAAVDLTLKDSRTGDPVAELPAAMIDSLFTALSTDEGKAAILSTLDEGETEEREVVLGEDDPRYKTTTATVTIVGGEEVTLKASLERQPTITNR